MAPRLPQPQIVVPPCGTQARRAATANIAAGDGHGCCQPAAATSRHAVGFFGKRKIQNLERIDLIPSCYSEPTMCTESEAQNTSRSVKYNRTRRMCATGSWVGFGGAGDHRQSDLPAVFVDALCLHFFHLPVFSLSFMHRSVQKPTGSALPSRVCAGI